MDPATLTQPVIREPFASAEEFIATFAQNVGGLISYVDASERVRFATRSRAEWFGETPEGVQGRTLRDLHTPESYARFEPWLRRALAGERIQYEHPHREHATRGDRVGRAIARQALVAAGRDAVRLDRGGRAHPGLRARGRYRGAPRVIRPRCCNRPTRPCTG